MRATRKHKKPGWLQKTLFSFNMISVVLLLLSYLASFISPSTFWPLAFFGLAYPAFLLINVLFIILWLIKRPKYALLSLITILLGWKFLLSTIGFREPTAIQVAKSSNDVIRIMTWNVHYFKRFEDSYEKSVKLEMLDVIRREQPDILCIQEFFTRKKGEYNFKKSLIELLETEHYYIEESAGNDYEMNGFAIFSKLPITNKGKISMEGMSNGNGVIFSDFTIKKKKIRVYNVHLQSIKFKPEDYEYLKEVKEIKTDANSTRRLSFRIKDAFIKRAEQVKVIKEHAESSKVPYVFAGDFNDTPISYSVNKMAKDMKNCFREKGSMFGVTYNGDFPNFQIDYILATTDFNVINYLIIDKKLSDHYPIRSDLEFKP